MLVVSGSAAGQPRSLLCLGVQVNSSLIGARTGSSVDNLPAVDGLTSAAPITERLKTEQSYRSHEFGLGLGQGLINYSALIIEQGEPRLEKINLSNK
ncbi:hypothetical protein KEM48_004154 [Puccinia striiformis f. sp. tritici PST-130]|nr:hypothetical protein KEM48_004154 [Puccinia striiformis f. sp. tritici PST-130]